MSQPLPNINDLNNKQRSEFISIVNLLFETASPLADHIWNNRPLVSYEHLIETAEKACLSDTSIFSDQELTEIMDAHPRIGAPKAQLSALSRKEQGYATSQQQQQSLSEEDQKVCSELQKLNEEYEKKFGFKFVIFVNGRARKDIIQPFKQRLLNIRNDELNIGLREMMLIARDRLKKMNK